MYYVEAAFVVTVWVLKEASILRYAPRYLNILEMNIALKKKNLP